VSFLTAL